MDLLSEAQRRDLAARLEKGMAAAAANDSMAAVRSRVLAAVALFDHVPQAPQRELEGVVRDWWNGKMAPALEKGRGVVARDDAYPLFELLHAMRDNTMLDLRESCAKFFKSFPIEHLVSHYPAVYEAPENEYRIGPPLKPDQPDLRLAALSRAAELAMVAYDANAAESQFLQGWLMHDQFMLRGTFGAPYEFLWADPYQPGLSYYLVPLVYHNSDFGRLFVRSSWEDDARWFGYFDGVAQIFAEGRLTAVNPRSAAAPISLEEAVVSLGCAPVPGNAGPGESGLHRGARSAPRLPGGNRRRRNVRRRHGPRRNPGAGPAARQGSGGAHSGSAAPTGGRALTPGP
jgi:hypothetical protein